MPGMLAYLNATQSRIAVLPAPAVNPPPRCQLSPPPPTPAAPGPLYQGTRRAPGELILWGEGAMADDALGWVSLAGERRLHDGRAAAAGTAVPRQQHPSRAQPHRGRVARGLPPPTPSVPNLCMPPRLASCLTSHATRGESRYPCPRPPLSLSLPNPTFHCHSQSGNTSRRHAAQRDTRQHSARIDACVFPQIDASFHINANCLATLTSTPPPPQEANLFTPTARALTRALQQAASARGVTVPRSAATPRLPLLASAESAAALPLA